MCSHKHKSQYICTFEALHTDNYIFRPKHSALSSRNKNNLKIIANAFLVINDVQILDL